MGGERQGSKGGRYVGGFLHLFDWNAKSRKKLFPSRNDLPEHPKQAKQSEGYFPTTRIRMVDEDEFGAAVSIKASSDYSCASSVTDEDGYGTRAPGVVARLMGLDCLPTSNALDPYSSPFSDTQSLREAPFRREDLHFLYQEHPVVRSGNFLDTVNGLPKNTAEPKNQKPHIRPIEKFQREILPPRSAKSIPITHHKLLSPIKKPNFIPSKDVAHMMEAAAKIIEPGPPATTRSKISSSGSSSAPLRVRELKEKMEASQKVSRFAEMSNRTFESNAARNLKGKSMNKSWNGAVGNSTSGEGSAASTKNKGKSISLAIQAKVNVQRREGMNQSQNKSEGMKEEDAFKQTQLSNNESSSHKITHKKPSARTSTALRQNNQKQNCNLAKENLHSKPSANNLHSRKVVSGDSSLGRQKNLYKDVGSSRAASKKSSLEGRDVNKDVTNLGARNVPRKKRSIDDSLQDERTGNADTMLIGKNEKLSKSSSVADRHFPWTEESRNKGNDVVSFTFTAPMTRPVADQSNSLFADNRNKKAMLCPDSFKLSSLGYDVGADSLSILLEQKLRELTNGIDSSRCNFIKAEESSSSARQNAVNFSAGSDCAPIFSSFSSTDAEVQRKIQVGDTDECSSTKTEARQSYNFRLPSPVSVLDPSGLIESCNSSDSTGSNMTEECRQQSSNQSQDEEMLDSSYLGTIRQLDSEKDLSDSACSFSSMTATDWELSYIKDILCNIELMYNDYTAGNTQEIISHHIFNQLERERGSLSSFNVILQQRKALFDCVSECLEWRCEVFRGSGFRAWAKGSATVKRKTVLAEEVYKEINGWRSMRNAMVDELVDKDMSVQQGRWLDFEVDEFEAGVEIEDEIVDSLVDELVGDMFPMSSRWSSSNSGFLLKM